MLNGIDTGRLTPIILDRLESGKPVSITVSKEGYETWRRKGIAINTDETTPLMAALTKKEIAAKPVERPVREEPAREVSGEPATIRFDSNPSGADVFINDEFKGSTPIQATGIRPGRVKLLVSKSGYLKYASTVTLAPGENPSLGTIQLQDLYGELSLSSTPPRADIYFDGDLIAPKTPVTIRKVPRDRSHTVRLILEGYQTWEASFEMKDSPSKIYNVTLEKK